MVFFYLLKNTIPWFSNTIRPLSVIQTLQLQLALRFYGVLKYRFHNLVTTLFFSLSSYLAVSSMLLLYRRERNIYFEVEVRPIHISLLFLSLSLCISIYFHFSLLFVSSLPFSFSCAIFYQLISLFLLFLSSSLIYITMFAVLYFSSFHFFFSVQSHFQSALFYICIIMELFLLLFLSLSLTLGFFSLSSISITLSSCQQWTLAPRLLGTTHTPSTAA